jgi:hypothetical protein
LEWYFVDDSSSWNKPTIINLYIYTFYLFSKYRRTLDVEVVVDAILVSKVLLYFISIRFHRFEWRCQVIMIASKTHAICVVIAHAKLRWFDWSVAD